MMTTTIFTHPAHSLSDGLYHTPNHAALARCLIQSHHDVVNSLLHQLGCFIDGIVCVGCLRTRAAD